MTAHPPFRSSVNKRLCKRSSDDLLLMPCAPPGDTCRISRGLQGRTNHPQL